MFGSGTYCDSTKGSANIAASYAGGFRGAGRGSGALLRIAIPKTAKIVKYSELQRKCPNAPEAFSGASGSGHTKSQDWRGVQATLAGYDAIHVDNLGYGHGFYVLLNRSIATVQSTDAKGYTIR